jgi:very-short-patch-repair endonuclease
MPRSDWTRALDAWFARHHGVISRRELLALGCPPTSIDRMRADGRLVEIVRGVYRSAHWPLDRMQRIAAGSAASLHGAIGLTTACQLDGLRGTGFDRRIHLITPHASSPDIAGLMVHRCRSIDPDDIVVRHDGIRVTTTARSLFDAADILGVKRTLSAMEQALSEGLTTRERLFGTVSRLAHPNRPGTRTALLAIRSRADLTAAMQSDLEIVVLDEIRRQGLPLPVTQFPMCLAGDDIHIDFAWPDVEVALEVDHPTWHDGFFDSTRDKHRDRKLTVIGWAPMRLTSFDATGGLADAIGDVRAVINNRLTGRDSHAA